MSETSKKINDPVYLQKMYAMHRLMQAIKDKLSNKVDDVSEIDPVIVPEEVIPAEVIQENTTNKSQIRMQTQAVSKIQVVQDVRNTWETEKKRELVVLGNGNKSYPEILAYLDNEIKNSTRMVSFNYSIPCFKNDGVYQLHQAIEQHIGVSKAIADQKPSGGGDRPLDTIDVILADGRRIKVPYGEIDLPDMGEDASINIHYDGKKKELFVQGTCQFQFQSLIDLIIDTTIFNLNTQSIYKSQAIEINASVNGGQPVIMNLDSVDSQIMIMDEKAEYALRPLKARIEQPEKCRANGIPIKFGVLIEGAYGTGKTLYAFKLGNHAIKIGWSFIYLKSPELLADTLRMAKTLDKNGHGIIVFVEDIDQVTRGDRNSAMQDILNTLDGGDTKDMNVISLFTTNHLELIEPTFLRGKRIGTIISMPMLTAKTAEIYVKTFCADVKLEGDFAPVYKLIEDSSIAPAFMAEIVENVKSNMIILDQNVLEAANLEVCVNSYLRQVGLSRTKDTTLTREVALVNLLRENLLDPSHYEKTKGLVKEALDEH
jgi:transitional endoplasmic reticulum ATPase